MYKYVKSASEEVSNAAYNNLIEHVDEYCDGNFSESEIQEAVEDFVNTYKFSDAWDLLYNMYNGDLLEFISEEQYVNMLASLTDSMIYEMGEIHPQ